MKSNKQRRQEIKAQRLRRKAQKARIINTRPVDRPIGTVAVTPALLRPTHSYGIPDFVQRGYYQDRPFHCKDCGVEEIWTAAQQQWWYEQAQGDVGTVAVRCRACRQQERTRKAQARRIHREGLAMKQVRRLPDSGISLSETSMILRSSATQKRPWPITAITDADCRSGVTSNHRDG